MFGLTLLGGIKGLIYASVIGSVTFLFANYSHRATVIAEQKATIERLENNLVEQKTLIKLNKDALSLLDNQCQEDAQRFLQEHNIWKQIESSKDPLTDAVNFAIEEEQNVHPIKRTAPPDSVASRWGSRLSKYRPSWLRNHR